jgi:hypothetical protein
MSDTFYSLSQSDDYDGHYEEYYSDITDFDNMHHYTFITATIETSIDKAYLIKDSIGNFWCPKKLVRLYHDGMYIWNGFTKKYLENTVTAIKGDIDL